MVFLGTSSTEGALIHFAPAAKVAGLRILRRTKWAGIEAITTPNAKVLRVENHSIFRLQEAVHRANCHARRIRAVHACHGYRTLAWSPVIEGHHATPIYAPGDFVFVLTGRDTGVAFDAAFGVT
jgi:hypothetical protein